MNIRSMRPIHQDRSPKGFMPLGKFNLAVTDDITIQDCSIVKAPDGRVFLYGPGREGNALSCSPGARKAIIELALAALGMEPNDRRAA
ncbi:MULTISPECIES: hypothetical protein [unclassified Mesorhizobium]|uniref:hypothetical protein n=1 Tax=unclassified Mesorhizobium TaxID=325217 RepID=UPI00112E7C1F|nr:MULTISPECIES: hypothetical protein [unclassified Mesorhizobium]TPJ47245.1 hypothetical protein FJ437_10105 [Mesorhizobium sp. B2-6-6]MBZ9999646.1 hypothetical protein [Mesorhizobium sp. B264B2A]MCA0008120.1 hypothetical protein [Mesorhizobium sp. B264B1B]MCA0018006.1 hypothetical protein [Mesorhizobium sp. B264B1A]TPJ55948.1 hypothetical protein FJ462_32850 [Mesorhizobium sp. B2-6-7]